MNAVTAFSHREEELRRQLEQANSMEEAIAACMMALEQTACELAQEEQDELSRQRQQAVMACARRVPRLLSAVRAKGEMVLEETETEKPGVSRFTKGAGLFLLAALAVYELIEGRALFAVLELFGAGLLLLGGRENGAVRAKARGMAYAEPEEVVRLLREQCQAVDICVSDLILLEREAGMARLSGTADEAMLDLLISLLEAKESGRGELAMRSLAQAEQYLHMLGMEVLRYEEQSAAYFDVLPTMGEARTIRPAIIKDGQIVRRGVAARSMERSARG